MQDPLRGLEVWKAFMAVFLTAFPDAHFTMEDHFVTGDRVAHRWSVQGTHTGPLGPTPPTGRAIAITGLIIDKVAEGRWSSAGSSTTNR
jgi:predicted ester cyclase